MKYILNLVRSSALDLFIATSVMAILTFVLNADATTENGKPCTNSLASIVSSERIFKEEPRSEVLLIGEFHDSAPEALDALELKRSLRSANRIRGQVISVAAFQVIAAPPKDTYQTQYLGYNLMHINLKSVGFRRNEDPTIFVSTMATSIREVVDQIFEQTGVGSRSTKTREKLESQIELIASRIGSPSERAYIYASFQENTGSYSDILGTGFVATSIIVLNKSTGMTIEIDFFQHQLNPLI